MQRSPLLPLFKIPEHISMDVRDRYPGPWLNGCREWQIEKIDRRKALFQRRALMRYKLQELNDYGETESDYDEGPWLKAP